MSRYRTPLYSTDDLLGAIRQAAASTAGPLTQAAYVRWISSRPPRSEPSRGIIVKRLGSWRSALELAGVPAPARDGAGRAPVHVPPPVRAGQGRRQYTDAELVASLQAAALATGRGELTRLDYDAYRATRRRRSVAGSQTIDQRFGGWQAALVRAGLVSRARSEQTTARIDAARALRLFAATRPAARLSQGRYDRFRAVAGASLPTAAEITKAHGTWRDAIAAAGIDSAARHREQLLSALVAAAAFTPDADVTFASYLDRARSGARVPSYRTFYRAFDSWPAAVAAAGLGPRPGA
ncbi:MAG: Homing endonuclease associated repeat [Gaiellaceae bacterium]|jgi:hypothetical protein|nr:Homing endonuclease associated repeat [Gaiellaceae bacterium]